MRENVGTEVHESMESKCFPLDSLPKKTDYYSLVLGLDFIGFSGLI